LGVREYLQSRAGKNVAVAVVAVGVLAAIISMWSSFKAPDEIADASAPMFINAQTLQAKRIKLDPNQPLPSGWYKAELCYWTKDGKPKDDPTYVILNKNRGKPEPTFCPDCGRLVREHNPPGGVGFRPPPTEQEYKSRH